MVLVDSDRIPRVPPYSGAVCLAVFALFIGIAYFTAQCISHQLAAIADAQHRYAQFENCNRR